MNNLLTRVAVVTMLILVGIVFLIWMVSVEDASAEPGVDGGREYITHIHDSSTSVCHVHHYLKNGVLDDQYDDGMEKYENAEYCPMAYDTGTVNGVDESMTSSTPSSTEILIVATPSSEDDQNVRPARRERPRQNHALPLPTPGHGWIWHTTPTAQVDESDVDEDLILPPLFITTLTPTPTVTPTPLPITLVLCRSNHEIIWLLHWAIYGELACPGGIVDVDAAIR